MDFIPRLCIRLRSWTKVGRQRHRNGPLCSRRGGIHIGGLKKLRGKKWRKLCGRCVGCSVPRGGGRDRPVQLEKPLLAPPRQASATAGCLRIDGIHITQARAFFSIIDYVFPTMNQTPPAMFSIMLSQGSSFFFYRRGSFAHVLTHTVLHCPTLVGTLRRFQPE